MPAALLKVVQSLSFAQDRREVLRDWGEQDWHKLLALTDRSHLTLPLGIRALEFLPEWVQERLRENLASNLIRHLRTLGVHRQIDRALSAQSIDYLVLKGISQYPFYCEDAAHRPRYDVDLYCEPVSIDAAYRALRELGYEPYGKQATVAAVDHLPPLIRKTGWRFRGDYYDRNMPLTLELHFRLWDPDTERFEVPGEAAFWGRRRTRRIDGLAIPTLDPVDGLSYTAWHLIRHLLRGDLRPYHVYELAHFLHSTSGHEAFWKEWREAHPLSLVEAIAFRLAKDWFECDLNPVAAELTQSLPPAIKRWFELFAFSPLHGLERPNKDELFLHFCLVKGLRDRLRISRRRLVPLHFSLIGVDVHVPSASLAIQLKRRALGLLLTAGRVFHHVRTLVPVLRNGARWRRSLAR